MHIDKNCTEVSLREEKSLSKASYLESLRGSLPRYWGSLHHLQQFKRLRGRYEDGGLLRQINSPIINLMIRVA